MEVAGEAGRENCGGGPVGVIARKWAIENARLRKVIGGDPAWSDRLRRICLFLTKEYADRWIFMRELDFIVQDIEVEVELTGIFGFAFAALELNGDKTLEMAVKEQQILEDLLKFAQ